MKIYDRAYEYVCKIVCTDILRPYSESSNHKEYELLSKRRSTKLLVLHTDPKSNSMPGPSITDILHSEILFHSFKEYMTDVDELNILLFWMEVSDLRF